MDLKLQTCIDYAQEREFKALHCEIGNANKAHEGVEVASQIMDAGLNVLLK